MHACSQGKGPEKVHQCNLQPAVCSWSWPSLYQTWSQGQGGCSLPPPGGDYYRIHQLPGFHWYAHTHTRTHTGLLQTTSSLKRFSMLLYYDKKTELSFCWFETLFNVNYQKQMKGLWLIIKKSFIFICPFCKFHSCLANSKDITLETLSLVKSPLFI